MNHLDKLMQFLPNLGNNHKLDEGNVQDCLKEIEAVLKGSAKGRKASISPSQTNLTPRQIWFTLNGFESVYNPDQFKPSSKLKMLFSSVCEHVFALMLKEAGVDLQAPKGKIRVVIDTPDGHEIEMFGSDDYRIDGKIVDCKMPNEENYKKKFKSAAALADGDIFGYLPQAHLYSEGEQMEFVGWDVVCSSTGKFKHLNAEGLDLYASLDKFKNNYDIAKQAHTFEDAPCEFDYVEDSGNIPWQCTRCRFRDVCWDSLERIEKPNEVVRHRYVHSD